VNMKEQLFTLREEQILELVKQGYNSKEIALKLDISFNTVKFHIHTIIARMRAKTLLQAVVRAINQGFITSEEVR